MAVWLKRWIRGHIRQTCILSLEQMWLLWLKVGTGGKGRRLARHGRRHFYLICPRTHKAIIAGSWDSLIFCCSSATGP